MIVFDLICSQKHRFEGWFASGDEYSRQEQANGISCPICGNQTIAKVPSAKVMVPEHAAPVQASSKSANEPKRASVTNAFGQHKLLEMIDYVLKNTDDVGDDFPQEARRIHYDEAPARSIRGVATPEETEALRDEGIEVVALPIPEKKELH